MTMNFDRAALRNPAFRKDFTGGVEQRQFPATARSRSELEEVSKEAV